MENLIVTKAYEFMFFEDHFIFKQLIHKTFEIDVKYSDIVEFNKRYDSFAFYGSAIFKCTIKDYGELCLNFGWLRKNERLLLEAAIEQIIKMRTDIKMREYEQSLPKSTTIKCLHCAATISPGGKYCSHCGTRVGDKTKACFCCECGNRIESSEEYCQNCGHKVERKSISS